MQLLLKQNYAIHYLNDDTTSELLFGGGAGGGKSALGVLWIISVCQKYPGIRTMIGRNKLKALKETTLATFFQQASNLGLTNQYKYDSQANVIKWNNGSVILLKDLFLFPSDPNFDSLGSLEITFAFIDECNQIELKAWEVAKSRLRYKLRDFTPNGELTKSLKVFAYEYINEDLLTYENIQGKVTTFRNINNTQVEQKEVDKYYRNGTKVACEWIQSNGVITKGLLGKILGSCNPEKNWVYNEFYSPYILNELKPFRKFVQALPKDNPHLPQSYIDNLKAMNEASRKRLLEGDWDYDDNPNAMFDRVDILAMYTNIQVQEGRDRYVTADIAYGGSDRFVIAVWFGLVLKHIISIDKIDETQISKRIHDIRIKYRVPIKNVIYDADGLKMFVRESAKSGFLTGATQFHNGAKPLQIKGQKENFTNLKTQCAFKLAELVRYSEIYIETPDYRQLVIEEFGQIYKCPPNDEGKIGLEKKDSMRLRLLRSPDFWDAVNMRMFAEINKGIFKDKSWFAAFA
jgi:hypothetical protein